MAAIFYPTVPVQGSGVPEPTPPWPDDELSIRTDELFARRIDNDLADELYGLLHHPETGIAAKSGEEALVAIGEALPGLGELKERTLAEAMGPRQRSILEPLIDARLDDAFGRLGTFAQRATTNLDDETVARRISGLQRDAAAGWDDSGRLRKLGRAAVSELRYQGERRGRAPEETEAKARSGLSDLYAGAVEAALRAATSRDDLDGVAELYNHAREVIAPERQAAIDRRFTATREDSVLREVDGALAATELDPAAPPDATTLAARAAELTPDDASDETRTRIAEVARSAHRRLERQWNKWQATAGVAALQWRDANPEASFTLLPWQIRDWLAPDQKRGLETLETEGRLRTDRDLFETLDRQAVYDPAAFAAVDLDRHRLALGDHDFARFAVLQKAVGGDTADPAVARYRLTRIEADRALEDAGIDTEGPEASGVRADVRDRLGGFEAIEGRPPNGADIAAIVSGQLRRGSQIQYASPKTSAEPTGPLEDPGDADPERHAEWQVAQADGIPYIPSHMWMRIQQKGISPAQIGDAITNGKRSIQSNGNTKCVGDAVIVILNPLGGYVTCYWK